MLHNSICKFLAFACIIFPLATLHADTLSRPAKMEAKFRQDSIDRSQAYFIRKNKVKKCIQEESDSKTVDDFDRYGNTTKSQWWLDGKLYSTSLYEYNEFGNKTKSTTTYTSEDGKPESIYVTIFTYETDPSGLSQRVVLIKSIDRYFTNGKLTSTAEQEMRHEYNKAGVLIGTFESGTIDYCMDGPQKFTEEVQYEYDSLGRLAKEVHRIKGGCDGSHKEVSEYTNSPEGYQLAEVRSENGEVVERNYTTYTSNGQTLTYRVEEDDWKSNYEYAYFENGLIKSCTSRYNGKRDFEVYTYEYF